MSNNNNNGNNDKNKKRSNENYDRRTVTDPPSAENNNSRDTAAYSASGLRKGFYIILLLGITAIGIYAVINALVINPTARNEQSYPAAVMSSAAPQQSNSAAAANADTLPQTDAPQTSSPRPTADTDADTAADVSLPVQPPVSGKIIRDFSDTELLYSDTMKDWRTHNGVDIAANTDMPVTAIKDGTLKKVYEDSLLGSVVIVDHSDDGTESVYANLKEPTDLPIGSEIKMGDVLGKIGATAVLEINDPPHLHFEIRQDNKAIDPKAYVTFEEVEYVTPSAESSSEVPATPSAAASPAADDDTETENESEDGDDIETMIID